MRNAIKIIWIIIIQIIVILACTVACAEDNRAASTRAPYPPPYQYRLTFIAAPQPIVPIRTAKKGIGLAYPEFRDDAQNAGASWCYAWMPSGECGHADIEFVAMIWGRVIPQTIGASTILGANEPDLESQANIAPVDYVEIWREIEARFAGKKLIAPAPSQQDLTWLVRFRDAYVARYGQPPRLDALALHCYVSHAAHCQVYVEWMIARAAEWGISEVWLTEFGIWKCLNPRNYLTEIRNLVE